MLMEEMGLPLRRGGTLLLPLLLVGLLLPLLLLPLSGPPLLRQFLLLCQEGVGASPPAAPRIVGAVAQSLHLLGVDEDG